MAILENIMSNIYNQQKPETQRREAATEPRSMAAIRNQVIKSLLAGTEVNIRGEVTDLRQNQITISLPNGETITARTANALPLNIGQTADFVVSENDGKTITLKLLEKSEDNTSNEAQNTFAKKILTDNNIGVNDKNLSIVNTLMQHSQAVSRPNIQKYISMSFKYPEANPKDLIRMDINKIPINSETVKTFSEINLGQSKITSELNKAIIELNDKLSTIASPELREAFTKELSDILSSLSEENTNQTSQVVNNNMVTEATKIPQSESNPTMLSDQIQPADDSLNVFRENINKLADTININNNPELNETFSPNTVAHETTAPKASQLPEGSFFLEPKEFETKEKINKLYSAIRNTSEKLASLDKRVEEEIQKQVAKQAAEFNSRDNNSILMSQTAKLNNTLHFMDLINGAFPYMQLPIKLREENAQGELYVYKKKGGTASSDSLSCLLHLDLDHLGPTDIYIKLSGKKVHTAFTVTSESSEKIFLNEMPALSEALSKKGYELTNDIKIKEAGEEQAPLLSDFLEDATPGSVERYSFDMRA